MNRKILILIGIFLLAPFWMFSQEVIQKPDEDCDNMRYDYFSVTINPTYNSRTPYYLDITKIKRYSSNTIIHFRYKHENRYGNWVCADKSFYIRDIETKKVYDLIKTDNIPICPQHHYFQYTG